MGLDFAVLGIDGAPERAVSLGVDLHQHMIDSAAAFNLPSFAAFGDYYKDAVVCTSALPALQTQVESLLRQNLPPDLTAFLRSLRCLIQYALAADRPIHAIAD